MKKSTNNAKSVKSAKVSAPEVDTKATASAAETKSAKSAKAAAPAIVKQAGKHANPFTVGSKTYDMFAAAASANGVTVAELDALNAKHGEAGSGATPRMREILVRPANFAAAGKPQQFKTVWSVETSGNPNTPEYRYRITESAPITHPTFTPVRTRS